MNEKRKEGKEADKETLSIVKTLNFSNSINTHNLTFKINSKISHFLNRKERDKPTPLKATKTDIERYRKMETENRAVSKEGKSKALKGKKPKGLNAFIKVEATKKGNMETTILKTTEVYNCRLCLIEHRQTSKIGIEHRSHAVSKNKVVFVLEQQPTATQKYQLLKDGNKTKYQLIDEENPDKLPTKEQIRERIEAIQTRNYLRAEKGLIMPNSFKPKPKFYLNFSDYALNVLQRAYNDNTHNENDKPTDYKKNAYLIELFEENRNAYLNATKKDIDTLRRIKRLEVMIRINTADNHTAEHLGKLKWHLKQSVKDKEHIIARTQELFRYCEMWKLDKRYKHENEYQKAEVGIMEINETPTIRHHAIVSTLYKEQPSNEAQRHDINAIIYDKLLCSVNELDYLKNATKSIYATFKRKPERNKATIQEATIKAISRTLFYKPLRVEEIQALTMYLIHREAGEGLIMEIMEREGRNEGTQTYNRVRGRNGSTKGFIYTKKFGLCYNWDIQAKHSRTQQPESYKALFA